MYICYIPSIGSEKCYVDASTPVLAMFPAMVFFTRPLPKPQKQPLSIRLDQRPPQAESLPIVRWRGSSFPNGSVMRETFDMKTIALELRSHLLRRVQGRNSPQNTPPPDNRPAQKASKRR